MLGSFLWACLLLMLCFVLIDFVSSFKFLLSLNVLFRLLLFLPFAIFYPYSIHILASISFLAFCPIKRYFELIYVCSCNNDNNDNGFKETKLREFIEMLKIKRLVLNTKKKKKFWCCLKIKYWKLSNYDLKWSLAIFLYPLWKIIYPLVPLLSLKFIYLFIYLFFFNLGWGLPYIEGIT